MSRSRLIRAALGAAFAAVLATSPAPAQDAPPSRPEAVIFDPTPDEAPDAPVVAVTLEHGSLCLAAGPRRWMPPYDGPGNCRNASAVELSDPWLLESRPGDHRGFAGGAVDASTATVRYELRGGRTIDVAPQPLPALRGEGAQQLRFFALRLPTGAQVGRVLLLGADGAARAEWIGRAERPWLAGLNGGSIPDAPFSDNERVLRPTHPLRGRDWHVRAALIERSQPRPGAPLAREREICVRPYAGTAPGTRSCLAVASEDLRFELAERCTGPGQRVVAGIALRAAGRIRVEFGDGRIVAARQAGLATLGAPHLTVYGVDVPAGMAVRALRFDAEAGGWARRVHVALSPRRQRCDRGITFSRLDGDPVAPLRDRVAVTTPGAPALHLAETEDRICVQLSSPPDGDACREAPARLGDLRLHDGAAGVTGVVDARLRSVDVRFSDGTLETFATVAPPETAGPLARRLRYVVIAPRPGRVPLRFTGRSVDGLVVDGHEFDTPLTVRAGPALLRIGPWRVHGDAYRPRYGGGRGETCLRITRGASGPPPDCPTAAFDPRAISVDVRCDIRRPVLIGAVGRGVRRVVLLLDGGRSVSVPLRGLAAGGRGWVAAPPGNTGIVGVEYRGRRGTLLFWVALALPPAARQCGYTEWEVLRTGQTAKTAAAVSPPLVPMNDSVMITR